MSNLRDDIMEKFDAIVDIIEELGEDDGSYHIVMANLLSNVLCRGDFRNKSEATKGEYPLGHRVASGKYSIYTQFVDGHWSDHEGD